MTKDSAEMSRCQKVIQDFRMANKILKDEIKDKDKEIAKLSEEKKKAEEDEGTTVETNACSLIFNFLIFDDNR